MFRALVLVRNFDSPGDALDFGEFTISRVGARFDDFRKAFQSTDLNRDDWILEKRYLLLPPGPPGYPVGGIPVDVEDLLLRLRLYRVGDIAFISQATVQPSGNTLVQFPYRAMNNLNSYSLLRFEVHANDRERWQVFSAGIRTSQSWGADWFAAARRFFLSGGAKPFSPQWDDLDRILDYMTALEATLVPEKDYNTRRITRRGAAMIGGDDAAQASAAKFIKQLYEIRSRITHGSRLGDESRKWLMNNCAEIENRVRQILVAAVQTLPPGEDERRTALSVMYEPTDEDRGEMALQKFKEIKSADVRQSTAAKIARMTS